MALDLAAADAGDVALGAAEASRPLFTLSQCRPVTLDGNMSADYAPENAACPIRSPSPTMKQAARAPMGGYVALGTILCRSRSTSLPLRDTRQLVAALRKALELDLFKSELREYRDLWRYCLSWRRTPSPMAKCL